MNETPEIRVVMPCYNAGGRVASVLEKLLQFPHNVVVVDDGSTDNALEGWVNPRLSVLRFEKNQGKGHALIAGLRKALENPTCRAIITLDADGQHDPTAIPQFIAQFETAQSDLIIGARQFTGQQVPLRSRFGNTVTIAVSTLLLGKRLPDTQCGFRLFSRRFAEAVVRDVAGGRYETEMEIVVKAACGGWNLDFVPIDTIYEAGNPSSHFRKVADSFRIYRRLLLSVIRHRLSKKTSESVT